MWILLWLINRRWEETWHLSVAPLSYSYQILPQLHEETAQTSLIDIWEARKINTSTIRQKGHVQNLVLHRITPCKSLGKETGKSWWWKLDQLLSQRCKCGAYETSISQPQTQPFENPTFIFIRRESLSLSKSKSGDLLLTYMVYPSPGITGARKDWEAGQIIL